MLCMGRRWGKTLLGTDILVFEPDGALDGQPVGWFAPDSKLFHGAWEESKELLKPVTTHVDSEKRIIKLITGGSIEFWTMHNTDDPGRSRKYSKVFIDEAAMIPSERFRKQWQEAIRPTLTDLRGTAWMASTPKGQGYFKELFDRGQDPKEKNWMSWQLPTAQNPHIHPDEIRDAEEELPSVVFRQEYLAEFVMEFGAVFKQPQYYEPSELPRDGYREATGCDFAYTSKSGDWTVFITGRIHDGIIYITDLYREQTEATVWAERLKYLPFPFAFIGGQETGIAGFVNQDYAANLEAARAVTDKLSRAIPASAAWNRGEIRLPAGQRITTIIESELLSFTGTKSDLTDDIVDALAGLYYKLTRDSQIVSGIMNY